MAMFDKQIKITGKHAEILQKYSIFKGTDQDVPYYLNSNNSQGEVKNVTVFETRIECYMVGAILGIIYNRKSKPDRSSSSVANIFYDALKNNRALLFRLYHLLILTHSEETSYDGKIKEAFCSMSDEKAEQQQELFEDYVRGGLEILDGFFAECHTYEDFCNAFYDLKNELELDELNNFNL